MNLFFIRHGITQWNVEGRAQGREDICLNDTGRAQAEECAVWLKQLPIDCLASSPLSRAKETAQIIARYHAGCEVQVYEEFIERDFGPGSGLKMEEFDALYRNGVYSEKDRESRAHVYERVLYRLGRLAEKYPDGNVVVVTHGGVINAFLHETLKENYCEQHLDNVHVTVVKETNGTYEIVAINRSPKETVA